MAHNLSHHANGCFCPFGQAAKRAAQAMKGNMRQASGLQCVNVCNARFLYASIGGCRA